MCRPDVGQFTTYSVLTVYYSCDNSSIFLSRSDLCASTRSYTFPAACNISTEVHCVSKYCLSRNVTSPAGPLICNHLNDTL